MQFLLVISGFRVECKADWIAKDSVTLLSVLAGWILVSFRALGIEYWRRVWYDFPIFNSNGRHRNVFNP